MPWEKAPLSLDDFIREKDAGFTETLKQECLDRLSEDLQKVLSEFEGVCI